MLDETELDEVELDGAEDVGVEVPSDEGADFVSGAAFFSAGADPAEELLLSEELPLAA